MISRDRILSALYLEEPDRVPVFDFILKDLIKRLVGKTRWEATVHDLVKIYKEVGLDAFPFIGFGQTVQILEKGPKYVLAKNEWGNTFKAYDDGRLFLVDAPIKSLDQLDNYTFPEPKAAERTKGASDLVEEVHPLAAWGNVGGFFGLFAEGVVEASVFVRALYQRPRLVEKKFAEGKMFLMEVGCALIEAGCDAIIVCDDLAYKNGPFISPDLMRKFVFPHYREMNRFFHRRGVPVVLHTDGDVNLLLADIVEAGFDALHPLDVRSNMDLGRIKREFGNHLCLIGNVRCQEGTVEDVSRRARECIAQAAPGGGYILCSSNGIDFGVPYGNSMALLTTPKKYGRYR